MLIDYWTRFGETPLWTGIGWAITLSFLFYVIMHRIYRSAVTGTILQGNNDRQTLLRPIIGAYVFSVVMDLVTHEWVGAPVDAWICPHS